ncbi:hypothetical protein [Microcoleus sp. herbarium14]
MTKVPVKCRRIDRLKAIAYEFHLSNEDARPFGKLSHTTTKNNGEGGI